MSPQFRTITDLDITQENLSAWALSHETSEVVALAIHAIADRDRPAEDIWEDPTIGEFDTVVMAAENYVDNGLYEKAASYHWGEETIVL